MAVLAAVAAGLAAVAGIAAFLLAPGTPPPPARSGEHATEDDED
jgi:hypothetical protein